MLAGFGCLQAMECDEDARENAAALRICPVSGGSLPEHVPFDDRTYDLVCLFDVLEHIDDDMAALARLQRLLKPGGRLLVTVPAYEWLWSAHDEAHHHRRRYTTARLGARARSAGLVAIRLGYFNSFLFPLVALARIRGKLRGSHSRSDAAMPSPLVNAALTRLFALERFVVRSVFFPFGTSVAAVFSSSA